jgi:hypothetical protein
MYNTSVNSKNIVGTFNPYPTLYPSLQIGSSNRLPGISSTKYNLFGFGN